VERYRKFLETALDSSLGRSQIRVYAWAHETEDADHPRRHVTVLHIPPATSPRKAVQASIVSDYREQKGHAEN